MKNKFSLEKCHATATAEKYKRHWSRVFYDTARERGFKYAASAYRPNFVTGFDSDKDLQAFNREEGLYKLDFVKRWERSEGFDKWILSPYTEDGEHTLSAHFQNNERLVVAFFMRLK